MTMKGPTSGSCVLSKVTGVYGEGVAALLAKKGFRLGRTIGEGSYCKVKVAYRDSDRGFATKLACKIVSKKKASKDFVVKFLPREISIVRTIRHPHIVTVSTILDIDEHVYMFMDMCERGDLLDHIRLKGCLPEPRARLFFKQLVLAIEYLHSKDIAHRDLKCENILLADRDNIKIADFGFARWCCDSKKRRVLSDTFCGSAAYAAPEILQGIRYNPKMYDVWSLGCVLYIMLCGAMPFDDSNVKQMLKVQLQKRLTFTGKGNVTSRARRLVLHLLEPDVTKRATIRQVALCTWLNDPNIEYASSRPGKNYLESNAIARPSTMQETPGHGYGHNYSSGYGQKRK